MVNHIFINGQNEMFQNGFYKEIDFEIDKFSGVTIANPN
jgi:hypothetical protein